nr:hypothetical protein [Candidatus Sigynarchaeota archaeon]
MVSKTASILPADDSITFIKCLVRGNPAGLERHAEKNPAMPVKPDLRAWPGCFFSRIARAGIGN